MTNQPESPWKKSLTRERPVARKESAARKKPEDRKKPDARKAADKSEGSFQRKTEGRSKTGARNTSEKPDAPYQRKPRARKAVKAAKPVAAAPEELKAQPARLHKVMAAAGLGSRRALEQEIRSGTIQYNGTTATLGQSLKAGDHLKWGEREWKVSEDQAPHRTLVYNKPEGEITSRSDPEGRPTVFDNLPFLKEARWVAIGRLDINTAGLLILTTDGELASAMMHPSNQVDREYVCRVRGQVSDEQLEQLRDGIMLDDGPASFSDVKRMGGSDGEITSQSSANQWFQVTLLEGRNREVRRLWEALEHMVSRLKRVRYGAATLPIGLKVGRWQELNEHDHQVLREDVGLSTASAELKLQPIRHTVTLTGKPKGPSRHQARHIAHQELMARNPELADERSAADRSGDKGRGRAGNRGSNKLTLRSADSPWKTAAKRSGDQAGKKPGQQSPGRKPDGQPGRKPYDKTDQKPAGRPGNRSGYQVDSSPGRKSDTAPSGRSRKPSDRQTSKPGSPAGPGRRPHPKARRSER